MEGVLTRPPFTARLRPSNGSATYVGSLSFSVAIGIPHAAMALCKMLIGMSNARHLEPSAHSNLGGRC